MNRKITFFLLAILIFAGCTVYVQPPRQNPRIIIKSKPNLVVITGFGNVFHAKRYGGNLLYFDGRWYYYENGYWYISQYWKGPFVYIKVVPARVIKAHKRIKIHIKNNNAYKRGKHKGRKW